MKDLIIGITGSTGYLGSNTVDFFKSRGFPVKCLVRNRASVRESDTITYVEGDILEPDTLDSFIKGLDVCLHLAAFVGFASWETYKRVNGEGTKNLCSKIAELNPGCRFVYCSSISVLRRRKIFRFVDTDYGRSKFLGQRYAEQTRDESGLQLTIVYPGMIYGSDDKNFLPSLISYIRRRKLLLLSGGETNSPLIYMEDLCELLYRISIDPASANREYIGVNGEAAGIHDFFKMLAEKTGNPPPRKKLPRWLLLVPAMIIEDLWKLFRISGSPPLARRIVDVLSISLNHGNFIYKNNLNWVPEINMEEGLERALRSISPESPKR